MNSGNMSDIREVLASIEALNEEADRLNGTDQQEGNHPERDSLSDSLIAEMSSHKADVVLLDDVYRKGTSQQESKADSSALDAQQPPKSSPTLESKPSLSDAEFDQMLFTLVKDMDHQSRKVSTIREPKLSATGQIGTRKSDELTNLQADIDELLSPYLITPVASSMSRPMPATKFPYNLKSKKQEQSKQRDSQKALSDTSLLSAIITDDMRAEIADYILAEIKQQISSWISENLENIVEDALRSVSTEARDAVKARSVR